MASVASNTPMNSEVERFYRFLGEQIGKQGIREKPLTDVVESFRRTESEASEILSAVAEGLADLDSGRARTLDEVDAELRSKHTFLNR